MDIGGRIRQLRVKNNLTLEELASRTELTKGYLSQLENNTASPSVMTLEDIVEALGTDMSTFFREEKNVPVRFGSEDYFVDEKEGAVTTYIVPNAQANAMEPVILELEQGKRSQTIEPFEGEEFGYVLSGRITIEFEDEKVVVKKGETFYLHGNRSHALANEHKQKASVLWISTPPAF